ncbi:MAG: Fic family protein [Gemmataceae bacterium]|nr:Fic family protein [Gemmataceae bacterium]
MGLFTSNKVAWRKKIEADATTRTPFRELEQLFGAKRAKQYVELIYTKAKEQNNAGILETDPAVSPIIPLLMTKEKDAVLLRRGFYQGYMQDCQSGTLGTNLNNNLRPTAEFYTNPQNGNPTGRTLAIDQAANWICGGYVAALPGTRALLGEFIPVTAGQPGKFGPCLGRTPEQIWKVHPRLVPGLASKERLATKFINKYPSTVGAGFLFEELYTLVTGQKVWPPFGDVHWESIATFYMASIGTIQVFPDGNKRMGRFAYSVLLIKGTHTFKAPTDAYMLSLFRMQG